MRNFARSSAVPIAGPPPVGPQTGATTVPISSFRARALSASRRMSSSLESMSMCGAKEEVEAVEADAIDFGVGRQVEHRIQFDRRLGARSFADHARPGGIVEFGKVVGMFVGHGD